MWIDRLARQWRNRRGGIRRQPRRATAVTPRLETLEDRTVPAVVNPAAPVPPTISGLTPHTWTADANGLYHTATDLAVEWQGYYQTMLNPQAAPLTPIQHLEGNAEAVFENTGLSKLSAAQQEVDREDAQREFDAMAAAMQSNQLNLQIAPTAPLTEQTYLALEKTLQNNPVLLELAVQGHGLNDPPASRYAGYTNDFQNNVDNTTLYIGGGLNNNDKAIADFFDDNIITHVPFEVVWHNGNLTQLNQNGNFENGLEEAVIALDDSMYGRVYKSTDFSQTKSCANDHYKSPYHTLVESTEINVDQPPQNGTISTLWGPVPTTISGLTLHTWTADANGLYHTTTDLTTEWQGYYKTMLSGQGWSLTPIQRLEGNAEAVFENTGLSKLSAAQQEADREDAQREFDAIAAAMQSNQNLQIDPTAPLTEQTFLALESTLQNNPTLLELAVQGHGLNDPPASRYRGYTNDFQNNVDNKTLYVGGGLNNNDKAIAAFFDDNILSHAPFPVVWHNGKLIQLNQNGNFENTLKQQVVALNESMFYRVYTQYDFCHHR